MTNILVLPLEPTKHKYYSLLDLGLPISTSIERSLRQAARQDAKKLQYQT